MGFAKLQSSEWQLDFYTPNSWVRLEALAAVFWLDGYFCGPRRMFSFVSRGGNNRCSQLLDCYGAMAGGNSLSAVWAAAYPLSVAVRG